MIFNGVEYFMGMGDLKRFPPMLLAGQVLHFKFDDEENPLPGCKRMKKGKYSILSIDNSFGGFGKIYVLKKVGRNIKTDFRISTVAIDKAVHAEVVDIL